MTYRSIGVFGCLGGLGLLTAVHSIRAQDVPMRDVHINGRTMTSDVPQGWVGFSLIQNYDIQLSADSGAPRYPIIASVEPDAPAQRAGLEAGDTILAYGDIDARVTPAGIVRLLRPGQRIVFRIRRNGVRTIPVKVVHRPKDIEISPMSVGIQRDEGYILSMLPFTLTVTVGSRSDTGNVSLVGVRIVPLNVDLANALGIRNEGVLVLAVAPDSPAMKGGVKSGDVIVTTGAATPVRTPSDLIKAISVKMARNDSDRRVVLSVLRKRKLQKLTLHW